MKMVINNPVVDLKGIDSEIEKLVKSEYRDDFRDITVWLVKTGLGEKGAEEKLINSLITYLSKEEEWGVLIQITMQELECGTEIKAKIEKELQPVCRNIDFIVKSGALKVWETTYWFKVTPKVTLSDLAVTVRQNEITAVKSGNMQAFITLDYCGHDKNNPKPFTLFKNKKVFDVKLPELVTFK